MLPLVLLPLILCMQEPMPLLNYQDLQDLKLRIAARVVEVEVTLKVPDGADSSVAAVLTGQAVCMEAEAVLAGDPARDGSAGRDEGSAWLTADAAEPSEGGPVDGSSGRGEGSAWLTADAAEPSEGGPVDGSSGRGEGSAWLTADAAEPSEGGSVDGASGRNEGSVWLTADAEDPSEGGSVDGSSGRNEGSAWLTADAAEPGESEPAVGAGKGSVRSGGGVVSAAVSGSRRVVASRFLTENAVRVRVRCTAHPEWTEASVVAHEGPLPLVELVPAGPFPCKVTRPAPSRLQAPGTHVFSVDNPVSEFPNVFQAEVASWAEVPLAGYLLTTVGPPVSGPLFSMDARLVALNLRRYTPMSQTLLAATAAQVGRFLAPVRRPAEGDVRSPRRVPYGSPAPQEDMEVE
ncbi:MAG: hypothetical protein FJ109_01295 [Deltaproteobacteria bacterium]|nr:hypothetical protein [Deltaproteobacteria bacterium]